MVMMTRRMAAPPQDAYKRRGMVALSAVRGNPQRAKPAGGAFIDLGIAAQHPILSGGLSLIQRRVGPRIDPLPVEIVAVAQSEAEAACDVDRALTGANALGLDLMPNPFG